MVRLLWATLGPRFTFLCLGFLGLASAGPNLQSSRITWEYKGILEAALRALGGWLAARALPQIAAPVSTPQKLSTYLDANLQLQFDNGAAINAGRITVLGLQTVQRQSRGNLLQGGRSSLWICDRLGLSSSGF